MATVDELYAAGEQLKADGQYQPAIEKFLEVLQQDANFALAHFALAVVYGKLGQHDEAVRHGELGCQLEPNDPFSYTAMSVTYQRAFSGNRDPRYMQLAEDAMAKSHAIQAARRA